jgi:predicted O-methyltransferase YrrM
MEKCDLLWLAHQATTFRSIVELGSYLGRSTRALADNTPGVVLAIDDWKGPRDIPCYVGGDPTPPKGELPYIPQNQLFSKFKENVSDLLLSGKIYILVADHASLVGKKTSSPVDLVFLDGDHSYESVKRDVQWALSVLDQSKHSMICGHDAEMDHVWQAASDVLGEIKSHKDKGANIWWKLY